jgi:hypothetical protein
MLGWFRSKPECPVDPETRAWLDQRWHWLELEFGLERVCDNPLVLPRPDFFPDPYHGSRKCVRRLLDRVCEYMDLDPDTIDLKLYQDRRATYEGQWRHGTSGLYCAEGGRFRIALEAGNVEDPLALVGTMAHELGHVHLLGHGRISDEDPGHEPLTDLLTVYFGMGIFTANSVIREKFWHAGSVSGWSMGRLGYLGMPEYGYAFARFARARGEDGSAWARELRPDVRSAFKQAMRFLES